MENYKLNFGDIHFHTNYSDNKECATVKEMVSKALEFGLTIIGTGDHNHNFTKDKWEDQLRETLVVQHDRKILEVHPNFILLNNCEITLHLGHFLILMPEKISGNIKEAYNFLHNKSDNLLIINHPVPGYDYWHKRIIPHAKAIEVINGAVLRKISNKKQTYKNVLDIPMVNTYTKYLAMNIPVSAIGNSDAHSFKELGYGVTGYWMKEHSGSKGVEDSILELRTFAATDTNISIDWNYNHTTNIFSWNISIVPYEDDEKFSINLYNRNNFVKELGLSGENELKDSGLYWLSIFNGNRMAITSPVKAGEWQKYSVPVNLKYLLNFSIIESSFEKLSLKPLSVSPHNKIFSGKEISIYCSEKNPEIKGADGKTVEYQLISNKSKILSAQMGLLNEHELSERQLNEFVLWLNRNEVHEYRFINVILEEAEHLYLTGTLVPFSLLPSSMESDRWKNISEKLKKIDTSKVKIFSKLNYLPFETISLLDQYNLPLTVYDKESGIVSTLVPQELSFSGGGMEQVLVQRIEAEWS